MSGSKIRTQIHLGRVHFGVGRKAVIWRDVVWYVRWPPGPVFDLDIISTGSPRLWALLFAAVSCRGEAERVLTLLSDAGVLQRVKSHVDWSAARGSPAPSALGRTTRVWPKGCFSAEAARCITSWGLQKHCYGALHRTAFFILSCAPQDNCPKSFLSRTCASWLTISLFNRAFFAPAAEAVERAEWKCLLLDSSFYALIHYEVLYVPHWLLYNSLLYIRAVTWLACYKNKKIKG